jgi:hypothetical protein
MGKRWIGLVSEMILALAIIVGCSSGTSDSISGTVIANGTGLEDCTMTLIQPA